MTHDPKNNPDAQAKPQREAQEREAGEPRRPQEQQRRQEAEFAEKDSLNKRKEIENPRPSRLERVLKAIKAKTKRDPGLAQEREAHEKELADKKKRHDAELQKERAELQKERAELKNQQATLANQQAALDKDRAALAKDQGELKRQRDTFELEKQNFQDQKDDQSKIYHARHDTLERIFQDARERVKEDVDNEVKEQVESRAKYHEDHVKSLKDSNDRLREELQIERANSDSYKDWQAKLGVEDPAKVFSELSDCQAVITNLRKELQARPTPVLQAELERIKKERDDLEQALVSLREENADLQKALGAQKATQDQIDEKEQARASLQRRLEFAETEIKRLEAELKRYQTPCEEDREARIREIEKIPDTVPIPERHKGGPIDEMEWLKAIRVGCNKFGIKFPRRILHAFHTALKTADMSPLAVLAGVSGTGKSELPKLYAYFGGINFLHLAVQPNWDCQEAMLGFFNSIDNKFDAQPLLRLLVRSQKPKKENGLLDVMTLILLDEMNLAHVELYFAEFLSQFELRRSFKNDRLPKLEVKLGAGLAPYELPLGRNVLWAGTMNQDETTKTLSDKVLDRGTVIYFPSPKKLVRRTELKALNEQKVEMEGWKMEGLLPYKTWRDWIERKSTFIKDHEDQFSVYQDFIEETKSYLTKFGRSLANRVLQSIEFYMANYPAVRAAQAKLAKLEEMKNAGSPGGPEAQGPHGDEEGLKKELEEAMKTAFEDQLVQKVMPKLRGIETSGRAKSDCLDKIRDQLAAYPNLLEDFDQACRVGYGQFIWNSANYLPQWYEDEDEDEPPAAAKEAPEAP